MPVRVMPVAAFGVESLSQLRGGLSSSEHLLASFVTPTIHLVVENTGTVESHISQSEWSRSVLSIPLVYFCIYRPTDANPLEVTAQHAVGNKVLAGGIGIDMARLLS